MSAAVSRPRRDPHHDRRDERRARRSRAVAVEARRGQRPRGAAVARCPRSHWRRAGRRQPRGAPRAGRVRGTAAAGPDADALDDQRAGAGRHRAAARLRTARAVAGASAGAGAPTPRRHPYRRFGLPSGSRCLLRARPGHERAAQPVRVGADAGGDVRRPAEPGCLARVAVAGGGPVAVRLSALLLDQDGGPRAAGEGARVEARRPALRDSVRHQGGQELCTRAARARAVR